MSSDSTSLAKKDTTTLPPHDIIVNINGTDFYCQRFKLFSHSRYFQQEFKLPWHLIDRTPVLSLDKVDILHRIFVTPEMFKLFLDFINGNDVINDSNVQVLLSISRQLKSDKLREACEKHFLNGSRIPLKTQLQLTEDYYLPDLMTHVRKNIAAIKDVQELAEAVPKDLKHSSSDIKDLLLQKSLELLGIRKPPASPQVEDFEPKPEHEFEGMMNEFLDQVEVQNQQGLILADQATLLHNQVMIEKCLFKELPSARVMAQEDPRMKALGEELRSVNTPVERNAVRAQIQVIQLKNVYSSITENQGPEDLTDPRASIVTAMLFFLVPIIKQGRAKPSTLGGKPIDEIYRKIVAETREVPALQIIGNQPLWMEKLKTVHESCQNLLLVREALDGGQTENPGIPDGVRQVADGANFKTLNDFVQIAREAFYGKEDH
ncbi:hypothetical protein CAEBREN_14015 [Caenorhabditis brenneri]|uniref:BTB domain-containing protein n=1 Tax=Caenorhabditis brenneri TaxID=135651 RepID=G0MUY0_CAEBE|nr:hypothetical protein CAEBREN_14015 [Caenorhabditis brenneri]